MFRCRLSASRVSPQHCRFVHVYQSGVVTGAGMCAPCLVPVTIHSWTSVKESRYIRFQSCHFLLFNATEHAQRTICQFMVAWFHGASYLAASFSLLWAAGLGPSTQPMVKFRKTKPREKQ